MEHYNMNLTLKVWRQKNKNDKGGFETYNVKNISSEMSFLEMFDVLNEQLVNENKVASIEVYSMGGQLVKSIQKLEDNNSSVISFNEYTSGTYSILLLYSNGEQKSITIIKK